MMFLNLHGLFGQYTRSSRTVILAILFASLLSNCSENYDCDECKRIIRKANSNSNYLYSNELIKPGDFLEHNAPIKYYSYFIDRCPNYSGIYYARAKANQYLGRYKDAIVDYTSEINKPSIGFNYCSLQDEVQVVNSKLIMLCYFERGMAKFQLSDYGGAISDYSQAIKIDSTNSSAHFNRGLAHKSQSERQKQSLLHVRGILGSGPLSTSKYNKAVADFSMAIEIDPFYTGAYMNRALLYGKMGKYEMALKDYSIAIEINPNEANAYIARGLTEMLSGNAGLGCLDFSSALELGHPEASEMINKYCN